MKFKNLLITSSLILGMNSNAEITNSTVKWNEVMGDFNLTPKYHGFCYTNDKSEILGPNPHRKVRLASTTKLITALVAIDKLGVDYEYSTKFSYDGESLHIHGDDDPIISKRKLFFLISQLNNLGIKKIKNITFDESFKAFSMVEDIHASELKPTIEKTQKTLKDYFTVVEWNLLKDAYEQFISDTPEEVLKELQIRESLEDIELSVEAIVMNNVNPLDPNNSKTYEMLSPAVTKYLKIMNIFSNNYIADEVFNKLGGQKVVEEYIEENIMKEKFKDYVNTRQEFGKNEASFKIYTGSGLNTTRQGARVDNYATCAIMVELIKKLDEKLLEMQRTMQEVVAVPGVDSGTFKSRLNTPRLARSILAKTGTLKHTSTLAGKIESKSGPIYFGMFHQMAGWKGNAKIVQNMMVSNLLEEFGGANKFEYEKEFFFPASSPLK